MTRPTRRGLMGGVAALIPTAATVPTVAAIDADRVLIAACTEFVRLEAEINRTGLTDDERDAMVDRVYEQQGPYLAVILTTPCTTLAGLRAVVRAWTAWSSGLLQDGPSDTGTCLAGKVAKAVLAMDRGRSA